MGTSAVQSGLVFKFTGTSWTPELISPADVPHPTHFHDWRQRASCWRDLTSHEGPPAEESAGTTLHIQLEREHASDGNGLFCLFQIFAVELLLNIALFFFFFFSYSQLRTGDR